MIFLHFDSANSFANGGNRISPKSFSRAAKSPGRPAFLAESAAHRAHAHSILG